MMRLPLLIAFAVRACALSVPTVDAQTRPLTGRTVLSDSTSVASTPAASKTTVEFEIVTEGTLGIDPRSRDWAEIIQDQGASVRIRQPLFNDELGVTEKTRGTLRWVKVIAALDEKGCIVLPDQKFSPGENVELQEWIGELKLYGAQGSPEGKPLWGLSEEQFKTVFAALSEPVPVNSDGTTADAAIEQMQLPAAYSVRYHSTAAAHLSKLPTIYPVRQRLAGLSKGTSLAIVLADYGLSFRPLRTPTNEIELVVQPLAEISDPWPVGWELEENIRRNELAPTLFKMVPVEFSKVPVADVLAEIARVSQVPIAVDHYAAEQKEIDLSQLTLSYPSRNAAWITVINSAAVRHRMKQELRVDEQGKPFVRVAPFVPSRRSE
ncbi:MAG: hypothetical protein KDA93_07560 [Planctomycetaceae bacterium]|nr:hypothetical protein [Planctomycetaceae bacterium]